ncbi:MAG: hydantoinase B/oxoprolinase family protein, partial [Reyranella sp.]|nr:hydantoinase B/oxoprolinase family protein [Reyranella sp.]
AGPAGGGAIMNVKTTDNRSGRTIMASIDPITGGAGGWSGGDGADGSGANSSFLKNTPVEINETEVPIKVIRYGLVPDSGGAGRHRGGLATQLEFKVFAPNTVVTARNRDRTRFSSWGSKGGQPGNTSCFWRNPGGNDAIDLGNTDVVALDPGDVILVTSSGGGGFGPSWERDAKAVLFDVEQGKVSVQAAADKYGVVIRDGAVDETATAARRARLSKETEARGIFAYNAEREAYEREWTDANYAALTEVLATLPVNWRHYLKKRIFAALQELPAHQRRGDGSEVRRAFELAVNEFPQLRPAQAAE